MKSIYNIANFNLEWTRRIRLASLLNMEQPLERLVWALCWVKVRDLEGSISKEFILGMF